MSDQSEDAATLEQTPEAPPPPESTAITLHDLETARATNNALMERLRDALCATEPTIHAGMIRGETLEEVEASFADAKALVERVRKQVAREAVVVSPGAPGRQQQVLASPIEKIRAGLSR